MKRRYKLALIILIGIVLTFLINKVNFSSNINLVAIGDSLSLGMTPYKVAGTSFNDYLKNELESKRILNDYNDEFSIDEFKIHTLNECLNKNIKGKYSKIPIKQIIAKADILTFALGIDEFSKLNTKEITDEFISNYLKEVEIFFSSVREFYEKKIILLGLYSANNFSQNDAIKVNEKLKIICGKYDVVFIDILALTLKEDYYLDQNNYYLNYKAHKDITKLIKKVIM